MNAKVPLFLEKFDLFDALSKWKGQETPYAVRRSWEIRSFGKMNFTCRLNWSIKGQMGGLDFAAVTPQEAVWAALEEFNRLEKEFDK
jgi:hypothetical protein